MKVSRNSLLARADEHRRADTAQEVEANRAIQGATQGTGYGLYGPIRSSIGRGMIENAAGASGRDWDAYFQSMRDQGVDRMAGGSLPFTPRDVMATGRDNSDAFGLPATVMGADIEAAKAALQRRKR